MNKITLESRDDNVIIYIPPYQGLASFKIKYDHRLKKPVKNVLKITLTVGIELWQEFTGNNAYKIMSMEHKYRVNIKDSLIPEDLAKVWHEAAKETVKAFNDFEEKQSRKKSEIEYSTEKELIPNLIPLVEWYNKLP